MAHKTRTDIQKLWHFGPASSNFEKCLLCITAMPTSELRTIIDEFHKQELHRDMHQLVYIAIVGEMVRRVDPREFRAYGTY
jgi:hypothetical protein